MSYKTMNRIHSIFAHLTVSSKLETIHCYAISGKTNTENTIPSHLLCASALIDPKMSRIRNDQTSWFTSIDSKGTTGTNSNWEMGNCSTAVGKKRSNKENKSTFESDKNECTVLPRIITRHGIPIHVPECRITKRRPFRTSVRTSF